MTPDREADRRLDTEMARLERCTRWAWLAIVAVLAALLAVQVWAP